jgi:hypothetical protein
MNERAGCALARGHRLFQFNYTSFKRLWHAVTLMSAPHTTQGDSTGP